MRLNRFDEIIVTTDDAPAPQPAPVVVVPDHASAIEMLAARCDKSEAALADAITKLDAAQERINALETRSAPEPIVVLPEPESEPELEPEVVPVEIDPVIDENPEPEFKWPHDVFKGLV